MRSRDRVRAIWAESFEAPSGFRRLARFDGGLMADAGAGPGGVAGMLG